jgi:hypothetical protein
METSDPDAWDVYLVATTVLALGVPALFWNQVVDWSLEHRVFLPAAADPQFVLPYADGAGVDLRRVALAVIVVVMLVVAAVTVRSKVKAARS